MPLLCVQYVYRFTGHWKFLKYSTKSSFALSTSVNFPLTRNCSMWIMLVLWKQFLLLRCALMRGSILLYKQGGIWLFKDGIVISFIFHPGFCWIYVKCGYETPWVIAGEATFYFQQHLTFRDIRASDVVHQVKCGTSGILHQGYCGGWNWTIPVNEFHIESYHLMLSLYFTRSYVIHSSRDVLKWQRPTPCC